MWLKVSNENLPCEWTLWREQINNAGCISQVKQLLPPFHSTCPLWLFSRGNSGISPKHHTICVDQCVSYLELYNVKSGRFGHNLHFTVWNKKITTSASFPYEAHAHGSWWPCDRWGSCSWGQYKEKIHECHHMMLSDSTDLGEPKVGKRGTIFLCDTVRAVICMSHVCPILP